MARGKDEKNNPLRKVGRGHPLLAEQKQQRKESGYEPAMFIGGYDVNLEERLRQRPKGSKSGE
jgi:hypothetical protein